MVLYEHICFWNMLGLVESDYRFVIKYYYCIYLWSRGHTTLKTKWAKSDEFRYYCNRLYKSQLHFIPVTDIRTRASPWGRASSCVRPSLVTRIQVTKEFPSGLVMSKLKGNAESTGRTTRSTSYFHQYFKTTIYIHQESFKQIDWILRKFIQPNIRLNIQNVNRIDTDLF